MASGRPTYKIILLGESNTGKSTLLYKYNIGYAPAVPLQNTKIAADIIYKVIDVDGKEVKLEIWDPSGQEAIRNSIIPKFYRNAHAVVFIYDITNRASFRCLDAWISECRSQNLDMSVLPVVLLANKCDQREQACIGIEEGKAYAERNNFMFYETSAYNDRGVKNVEDVFVYLARILKFSKHANLPAVRNDTIQVAKTDTPKKKESSCGC